ncbi:MAG: glycoside hydrolase family 3 C-terminal domain-containing protein [Clostridia bacterium]|nr:glycoside hydrolase family 3 C-terminal domain-containing protein [Clostridia bacterium]
MYNPTEKWLRARFTPALMLGDNRSAVTACERHITLSRKAACEGAVLLKNNGILPLEKGTKLAVFGKAQIDYVKGGGGSGDVYSPYVRNIYEGLKMKGKNDGWNSSDAKVELFHALSLFYESYILSEYEDPIRNYYKEEDKKCNNAEPKVPAELMRAAAEYTDTAVITICRHSGEGHDKREDDENKYFALQDGEKEMVADVLANFKHVIVLLNVGAMIDTSWFKDEEKIEAALVLWQGGMEGGLAAADMLVGDDAPGGKLVDTCAANFSDYPSSAGFHESDDYVKYTEDIFVGYRYFETIPGKKDAVVYPFGYGLTYTTFKLSDYFAGTNGKRIFISVDVTNTGTRAGKEVVQVYYSAPKGKISKEKIALAAFAKTPLIEPGKKATVSLYFDVADMASFDDMGDVKKSAYVLEAGEYKICVGTSVRDNVCIYKHKLEETVIVKKCKSYCAPKNLEKRLMADGSLREVPARKTAQKTFAPTYHNEYKPREKAMEFYAVADGRATLDEFISQMSDYDLMDVLTGKRSTGVANTGTIGGFDNKYRIQPIATADGPAGLRLHWQRGVRTTSFPVATALACTWNTELVEKIGEAGALECKENNLQIWLTPALNIHRSPLCGRNFEYYSEDPLVAGKMAAAMVRGIQSQRVVATPKHFVCNNKETNRLESDSIVSERALREIYLKGFEICVKESSPKLIMSSYNRMNGIHTSENAELITGILRGEWGYEGAVTTDWSNTAEHYKEVKAGNDVRMPCQEGLLKEPYEAGLVTRDEMAACAKRILEMILWVE